MYDWTQGRGGGGDFAFPGISLSIPPAAVCNGENDCGNWEDEDSGMCETCPKVQRCYKIMILHHFTSIL